MSAFKIFIALSLFNPELSRGEIPPQIVGYIEDPNAQDNRNVYQKELLELALEKTIGEFGPYRMIPSFIASSRMRAIKNLKKQSSVSLIRPLVHEKMLAEDKQLSYIDFPIYLNTLGYRICFTSSLAQAKLTDIKTLNDLKGLTHSQGLGWIDAEILRYNGFTVFENPSHSGIFRTLEIDRVDLFCRGINEFNDEMQIYSAHHKILLNRSFGIYYPLPVYFYTASRNTLLKERISKGLEAAFQDGSLLRLWEKFYSESVRLSDIKNRQLFKIANPYLPSDYQEKYHHIFEQNAPGLESQKLPQ